MTNLLLIDFTIFHITIYYSTIILNDVIIVDWLCSISFKIYNYLLGYLLIYTIFAILIDLINELLLLLNCVTTNKY